MNESEKEKKDTLQIIDETLVPRIRDLEKAVKIDRFKRYEL